MAEESSLQDKYYELLKLQRRVNKTLESHMTDADAAVAGGDAELMRVVEGIIRADTAPATLKALTQAACKAAGLEPFAKFAQETEIRVRLRQIESEFGTPAAFQKIVADGEQELKSREAKLRELQGRRDRLSGQLKPVFELNDSGHRPSVREENRQEIEAAGFWARANSERLNKTCEIVGQYQSKYQSNCFEDLKSISAARKEIEGLEPEIAALQDKNLRRLATYNEMRDLRRTLGSLGVPDHGAADMPAFRKQLAEKLRAEPQFLARFAAEAPSALAGSIVLAALTAGMRRQIRDNLAACRKQVGETTALLEGPIGTIAKAMKQERAIDGIAADIRAQAVMAGYLCVCASQTLQAVGTFRPEHAEGAVTLGRELRMHMALAGGVDTAYIREVAGMDGLLTKYFNLKAGRGDPDFKAVFAQPESVERIDRHYARFLHDSAGDEDIAAAGFAAGQFDVISFEMFLGRYFPAGTSAEQLAAAVASEAAELEDLGNRREAMGISRDGPQLPGLGG